MKKKPTLGIFGFTGCAGCQLALLDCEDQLLDLFAAAEIKVFYEAMSNNEDHASVDIALVEGSINTDKQIKELKEIREKSKLLVAFGSCAHHGCVQAMALGDGQWEKRFKGVYGDTKFTVAIPREAQPIHKFVKVDTFITGCPPSTTQMLRALTQLLHGNLPTYTNSPVCLECKLKENECLLLKGELCLGPLTMGGCTAPCPSHNTPCIGCWGIIEEANHTSELKLLKEKGFKTEDIIRRFRMFGGSDIVDKIQKLMEVE
ncbi:MAG TPA: hypothetical protein ENL20_05310 [Candidatus Cloacimonetes bacterium]|nr:hypothetical protein [Candidatus Cloacimonadota bacterium]